MLVSPKVTQHSAKEPGCQTPEPMCRTTAHCATSQSIYKIRQKGSNICKEESLLSLEFTMLTGEQVLTLKQAGWGLGKRTRIREG